MEQKKNFKSLNLREETFTKWNFTKAKINLGRMPKNLRQKNVLEMFHNILQTSRNAQLFVFSQSISSLRKKEKWREQLSCSEFKGNAYIFTTHGYCKFYKYWLQREMVLKHYQLFPIKELNLW